MYDTDHHLMESCPNLHVICIYQTMIIMSFLISILRLWGAQRATAVCENCDMRFGFVVPFFHTSPMDLVRYRRERRLRE